MPIVIAIALGGALGALSRHFMARAVMSGLGLGFPYGTLAVNILGSFLMGIVVAWLMPKFQLSPYFQAFLTVGFLGGFTTFSAFSLEVVNLMERNELGLTVLYIFLSVLLAVGALFIGLKLGRTVLA